MEASEALKENFIAFSREKLIQEMWPRLCSSLDGLTDEQIWWRPNEASNSIGNLLLHLNGNVRQWVLQALGGIQNIRDRDTEFRQREPIPVSELRAKLDATVQEVDLLLERLTVEDLLQKHNIQVYEAVPGMDAIYHVVEHFSMHYGQILFIAKLIRGRELGFYAYLNNP